MPASDLLVYTKTENLLFRLYPVLVNYPKSEKFALSQQIKECLYNTLRCISLGNRKVKKMRHLLAEGEMSVEKAEQILSSWSGHAGHGDSYSFIQKLIKNNDYIYLNKKGALKVDKKKLKKEGNNNVNQNA